jgi:RNA polymerase sigma-70 factor (ECF subfamily)
MEPLDSRPDAALVAVVAAQWDPDALEELYRRHSVAAFGVARRVTGVPEHGEEVLQEVFLRLWRNPERFDPTRGALRSFLLMDANARAIELVRRDAARRGREERTINLVEPRPGDEIEGELWDLVVADHLREALDALTSMEREAIELAYYGGHPYREVATILGQPEGTVKSRIRSGLQRMRDRLVAAEIGDAS